MSHVARIKKAGKTFEISIDSDKALLYKEGSATLSEALHSENIFSDVKKGQIASTDELESAFETSDPLVIADIILRKGEVQVSSDQRAKEREQFMKKLVHTISTLAVDPTTGLPHPATRIQAAFEAGKIHPDYNKSLDDQLDSIISKLRPHIPLKIESKKVTAIIPGTHAGKCYSVVQKQKMVKETWNNDGSWTVTLDIPAGLVPEFIDSLNKVTSGDVNIEIS